MSFMGMVNSLMSPLGREHCDFFYVLSMLSLLSLISVVAMFVLKKGKKNVRNLVLLVVSPLLAYYVYRLFYSMCARSL